MRVGEDKGRRAVAEALLNTKRGHLIIGRALDIGVQELEKVDGPLRECSDIDDMKLLRDELFSWARQARELQEQLMEKSSG